MMQHQWVGCRKLNALLFLSLSAVVLAASSQLTHLVVPDDQSLSVERYTKLGLPDPAVSWSAAEYGAALEGLAKLPGNQLPAWKATARGWSFSGCW